MKNPRVFISYSHDSPDHIERVLKFSWALRDHGIDVELDQFHNEEIVDWPRWCNEQISRKHSDFVVCVCTEEYNQRIEGGVKPEKGKGVYWEGSLLDDDIYDEKGNRRIIPVLFDAEQDSAIPRFLRGWTLCRLYEFKLADTGFEKLLRILTGKAKIIKNELGPLPDLPTQLAPSHPKPPAQAESHVDISRILKYAPAELIGRENELKLLNEAWAKVQKQEKGRPHVLTFVALGGEGKTSLVAKWAAELAGQDWPGCDAVFAWSFYSQGTRDQIAASSDLFLKEALNFFGDDKDKEFAASAAGAFEKGQRLARIVGQRRNLLILDGLEPLQYAPTSPTQSALKDQGINALLKGLAANSQGLCIVTTRYSIPDLKAYWQTTAPEKTLHRLSTEAGVHLLYKLGVRKESGTKAEFEKLVEDVKGHALTLNLIGTYLRDAHNGDIRKRDLVNFSEANAEEQGGHAFRVMDAYVKSLEGEGEKGQRTLAMLRLLGLFDRPATVDCMGALWKAPTIAGLTEPLVEMGEANRNLVLKRLEDAKLLTVNRDSSGTLLSLDAHPLLREYFARHLQEKQPDAWRMAHRQLYEHLCASTPDKPRPTLEDLEPLFQAVAHGCQAGLQQETCDAIYYTRISRRNEFYCVKKLGAFGSDLGAIACFFDKPWSQVSPLLNDRSRAWVQVVTAFCLCALGRLTEALEPMRTGLEMDIERKDWINAAISASTLSELDLTLGQVDKAVRDAEQCVTYADKSGEVFQRIARYTTHADALSQAGLRAKAASIFREAEQMQKEDQPTHPFLYSLQGFQYCDLLLIDVEQATWQTILQLKTQSSKLETAIDSCISVSQRAKWTFQWATNFRASLLSVALDHLTLGRAALYQVILEKSKSQNPKSEIEQAVLGLRRAGQQQYLPLGLIIHALFRFLIGTKTGSESAQADLDEAWEIAERGPMRLHMANIHLYRARLFFREKHYPWKSPKDDLDAAEKLINDCGYHRRDEELADAKKAILG